MFGKDHVNTERVLTEQPLVYRGFRLHHVNTELSDGPNGIRRNGIRGIRSLGQQVETVMCLPARILVVFRLCFDPDLAF